jgi:hypothetical protein
VHIKGVRDPLAPVRRAAETTIRWLGPCREFAAVINLEPNRLQEALLWNLLGGIMCDLAVYESLADVRPMKCYMDTLKKCLTSDAVHSIMPSHIVWSVKAKVRAISRSNMAQPQKRYRVYTNWVETGARDELRQEFEEQRDGPHDWLSIFKSIDVQAMCLLDLANLY